MSCWRHVVHGVMAVALVTGLYFVERAVGWQRFTLGVLAVVLALFLGIVAHAYAGEDTRNPVAPAARLGMAFQVFLLFLVFSVGVMGIIAGVFTWAENLWGGTFVFCIELVWLGIAHVAALNWLNDQRPRRSVPPLGPTLPGPPMPNAPPPPAAAAPAAPSMVTEPVTTTKTVTAK